jgi:processing peptidase subunit alpha
VHLSLAARVVPLNSINQILAHGRTISVSEMTDRIDEVTPESIRRVSNRIFGRNSGNKATIVAMGREDVDDWDAVLRKYGVGG